MFDRTDIERYIPQREPFVFIDEVTGFEPFRWARSIKQLTGQEAFFAGHFPDQPVMPGVLILENMAQTASFLLAKSNGTPVGRNVPKTVFGMVNRARFLAPVVPAADLVTEVHAVKLLSRSGVVEAVSSVNGTEVARAKLQFGAMA